MTDSSAYPVLLQQRIAHLEQPLPVAHGYVSTGHAEIDNALGGGLLRGRLHEIIAGTVDEAASAAGFTAICARLIDRPCAWLCAEAHGRSLYPHGLRELGIDPRQFLLISAPDPVALLRAANDALRCPALGTVVIELRREPQRIDLTTSRRLVLRAETSGVTALLLRVAIAETPNAAQTRWIVSAAPSSPMAANAPGHPALNLELLRQRGGPSGLRWHVEWDRDAAGFRTPLLGPVAAVPDRRSLAEEAGARRYAAN